MFLGRMAAADDFEVVTDDDGDQAVKMYGGKCPQGSICKKGNICFAKGTNADAVMDKVLHHLKVSSYHSLSEEEAEIQRSIIEIEGRSRRPSGTLGAR